MNYIEEIRRRKKMQMEIRECFRTVAWIAFNFFFVVGFSVTFAVTFNMDFFKAAVLGFLLSCPLLAVLFE